MKSFARLTASLFSAASAVAAFALCPSPLAAQSTVTFSSPGNQTWTVPAGVASVQVEAWGGGGGGGGAGANYALTGGGAGGSYVRYTLPVTAGTVINLTVGAGGAGGAGGAAGTGANGGTGGSSYFGNTTPGGPAGAVVLAVGGAGGALNNTAGGGTSSFTGSNGGAASSAGNLPSAGATLDFAGTNGTNSGSGSNKVSGAGGAGAGASGSGGGGAGGAAITSAGNGNGGTAPGGGGGGAIQVTSTHNGVGGAGGAGQIVLTFASAATISTAGTPAALSSTYGTASSPTTFTASGSSLTANITVSAPAGFEVSTTAGSGYASSVVLAESAGSVPATTVYVRLTASTAAGAYSGNVSLSSANAATQDVAIPSSTVQPLALTVGNAAVTTKPYDGTTNATITGALVGVIGGDTVNLVGTGTFAQATSGTGIPVTSTATLSGASASNYTLSEPTGLTGTILSSDNLGGVSLSAGILTPAFSAGTTSYIAGVPNSVASLTLSPTVDTAATVTVNGSTVASGGASAPINLNLGANTITVVVSEGGNTQTYTYIVTRTAPFGAGDLVVQQADNGSIQNTTITLLELSPSGIQASPVQSIPLPGTADSGAVPQALRINGSGGTTGYLANSSDGTFLAVAAADATNAADLGQTTAADIDNREVFTLNAAGDWAFQASYTGNGGVPSTGNQCRAATSLDNNTWFVADKGGIYTTSSASPATAPDSTTNMLAVKPFGGAVYGFSATAPGVTLVSSSGGSIGTLSALPGLSVASFTDFYLISSGVNGAAFDICYATLGSSATAGTINKYSLVNGTWVANGSYATNFGGRSMVAAGNGSGANLYLTSGNGSTIGASVVKVTDTAGYNQPINIVTANNVTLYTLPGGSTGPDAKGIAFAPAAAPLPDLTVGVSVPAIVASSANFTYTMTVANSGPAGATGVTAQFVLPSGLTYVSSADAGGAGFTAAFANGVVTFTGGALPANSSDTLTVTVTGPDSTYFVDAGSSAAPGHGSAAINTAATTTTPIPESNAANNYPNVGSTTHVGNVPYLTVDVSGSASAVADSSTSPVTYTVTLQNLGNSTATGTSLQFTLPAGLSFVSAADLGSAGFTANDNGGLITFSGGTLAAGASENLTVTAIASDAMYRIFDVYLLPDAAVATAANENGSADSPETVVTDVSLPPGPDLVVSSTPNGPFLAGDAADTFTIYVSNDGTSPTNGAVTVVDTLPSAFTPAASMNGAVINGWTLAVNGQTVTATRSDVLDCGATYPAVASGPNYYPGFTITFAVASGGSGSVSNNVTVSGGGDVFAANASVTNTVPIGTPAAISSAGYLLVSRAHYTGATIVAGSTILPNGATAAVSGAYPQVWQNEAVDESFGVAAPIYLDVVNKTTGATVNSTNLTALIQNKLGMNVTTSFSSKSELGLNLTPDGNGVTLSGYIAPAGQLDVSNANTLYHDDPTCLIFNNGDFQKGIIQVDYLGNVEVTPNNAYSGDNCRAALLGNATDGNAYYYTAGSAGNSGSGVTGTTMTMLAQCTGIQMVLPGAGGQTTAVGEAFGTPNSSTGYQLGYPGLSSDKTGKDMNLRGLTLNPYNDTLYSSKGSGGSGVDTLYQIGSGALPTADTAGSVVYTIPSGFPTASGQDYPFGMWFANAYTLYVADEGAPSIPAPSDFSGGLYTQAVPANNPSAGLQKWINSRPDGSGTWTLAYTVTNGLNLGVPYAYTIANYPTGVNPATGVPWQPANNGLRNIAGQINGDGTVTIYAITSTISGETDEGGDPNQLVVISDPIAATTLPNGETFTVLQEATGYDCLRGVALSTPNAPSLEVTFNSPSTVPVTANGYVASGISLAPITLDFAPGAGQVLTLVDNTGPNPITGTFANLPQGSTVLGNYAGTTYRFTVDYVGGGGNSITLALVPPTPATVALSNLQQVYNGSPRSATVTTSPANLPVSVTYNGSTTVPSLPGTYAVSATINGPNYAGSASGTLTITTAVVKTAPVFGANAILEGSVQMLTGANVSLGGEASISGNLLVPGTPTLVVSGSPLYAGVQFGSGSASPSNYTVSLSGNAVLGYLVEDVNPVTLPTVAAPPSSTNNLVYSTGTVTLPPGNYGALTVSGATLVLGASSGPTSYTFQSLNVTSGKVTLAGPTSVVIATKALINGNVGNTAQPAELALSVASGGITLNSGAVVGAVILAPNGTVIINTGCSVYGSVSASGLSLSGNGLLSGPAQ